MKRPTLIALLVLLVAPLFAHASGDGVKLDRAPVNSHDVASMQRGAQVFVNYCLNCHAASYMRYNRLEDLGLTEAQIRDNLMFAADKVGETMTVAMRTRDAKEWFGIPPPDLTVIARARGADWLYTYLRTFYRDSSRSSGWNNLVYDGVAMPHVLYQLQGTQALNVEKKKDAHGHDTEIRTLALEAPGALSQNDYDVLVADLVNYLVYMGEPARNERVRIGIYTLLALGVLVVFAWLMKREFWKDVH